jgi:hypothetical protein
MPKLSTTVGGLPLPPVLYMFQPMVWVRMRLAVL